MYSIFCIFLHHVYGLIPVITFRCSFFPYFLSFIPYFLSFIPLSLNFHPLSLIFHHLFHFSLSPSCIRIFHFSPHMPYLYLLVVSASSISNLLCLIFHLLLTIYSVCNFYFLTSYSLSPVSYLLYILSIIYTF